MLRLRFTLLSALILFALFVSQLGVAFLFQQDEALTIMLLTVFAWCYLILAAGLFFANRSELMDCLRDGLLNRARARPGAPPPRSEIR